MEPSNDNKKQTFQQVGRDVAASGGHNFSNPDPAAAQRRKQQRFEQVGQSVAAIQGQQPVQPKPTEDRGQRHEPKSTPAFEQTGQAAAFVREGQSQQKQPMTNHQEVYQLWDMRVRKAALQAGRDLDQRQVDLTIALNLTNRGYGRQDVGQVMANSPALHDRSPEGKEAYLRDTMRTAEMKAQQAQRVRREQDYAQSQHAKAMQYQAFLDQKGRER